MYHLHFIVVLVFVIVVLADDDSRTPSPSPSSGVESSSMKDSPMQIELGGDTTSIGECVGGSP